MAPDPGQKAWVAGVFDRAASTYDRVGAGYHEYFGQALVEAVQPASGAAVLDVACGRGAVLEPAAHAVGRDGRVVGVDISPEMVASAAARLDGAGFSAEVRVMDAEALEYADASFDAVFCAFGVFFFDEPARAAAEFMRVLRPGGSLAVSTWAAEDPRWAWEDELLAGVHVKRTALNQPFDTDEAVVDLLVATGFVGITSREAGFDLHLSDEDQWWDWKWSYSLRGVLEQLDDAELDRIRETAVARMQPLREERGYHVRLTARLTTATAPR